MDSINDEKVILHNLQKPKNIYFGKTSQQYLYTVDNNVLTKEQRDFYETNGYIVIRKLMSDDILDGCKERFIDYCDKKIDLNGAVLVKDTSLRETNAKGQYLYNKIQYFTNDKIFQKYLSHPDILKYVECFIGPDISVINSMLINKPPNAQTTTSVHPLHQDLLYAPSRPVQGLIGVWTAMEKATVDNGCLFAIPGTHKSVLQPHVYPHDGKNRGYYGIEGFDLVPKISLEMEKGDTVFIHPLLMHGSWPNISQKFRKALSCGYISNHNHFIKTKGTLHEESADEFVKMGQKIGIDLNIHELWSSRSRFIKGKSGLLQQKYISP